MHTTVIIKRSCSLIQGIYARGFIICTSLPTSNLLGYTGLDHKCLDTWLLCC